MDNTKAYSLVEVLIAVIIIGVIASIALVSYGHVIEKMIAKEGEQIVLTTLASQKRYAVENNGNFAPALASLDNWPPRPSQYFSFAAGSSYLDVNGSCVFIAVSRVYIGGDHPPDEGINILSPCGASETFLRGRYSIYVYQTNPQGEVHLGCFDGTDPICARLGY